MALDKNILKNALIAAFAEQAEEDDADAAINRICGKIADAVDAFVKSADGKYQGSLTAGATVVTKVGADPTVIKLS